MPVYFAADPISLHTTRFLSDIGNARKDTKKKTDEKIKIKIGQRFDVTEYQSILSRHTSVLFSDFRIYSFMYKLYDKAWTRGANIPSYECVNASMWKNWITRISGPRESIQCLLLHLTNIPHSSKNKLPLHIISPLICRVCLVKCIQNVYVGLHTCTAYKIPKTPSV